MNSRCSAHKNVKSSKHKKYAENFLLLFLRGKPHDLSARWRCFYMNMIHNTNTADSNSACAHAHTLNAIIVNNELCCRQLDFGKQN
jgi:hypothetical protein